MATSASTVEPDLFRLVLGHFPTGLAIITAIGHEGQPVGMAVGSFTSVSLDPPLVAFFPTRTSKTWPEIQASGGFCVNILSAQQEAWSRSFSRSGADKFAGVSWFPSPNGAPVLAEALAWIDCDISRVDEAGDHYVVFGAVKDMRLQAGSAPLVFFRGGYGAFQSSSLVAGDPHGDLALPLRLVDLGRPLLESFAERSDTNIAVTALVGDQTVVVAVAGASAEDRASGTYIGARVRAVPPIGATFMAWERPERVSAWMAMAPNEETDTLVARLDSIRSRGLAFSLEGGAPRDWQDAMSDVDGNGNERHRVLAGRILHTFHSGVEEPDAERVRNVHVPVFTPEGRAGLFLHVGGFRSLDQSALAALVVDIKRVAAEITELAAGPVH